MRFRKQEELPPTFDFDPYRAAFVSTVWLIYTTALVRFALGRWGTMQPEHARYVWVIAPMVFLAQMTMDLRDVDTGTSDPVGALLGHGTAPLDGPAIAYMAARLLPIAGFGLLLVSELAVYLFSLAAPELGQGRPKRARTKPPARTGRLAICFSFPLGAASFLLR